MKNIIIIGGGAAGFFAAITCAEANPNAKITILERGAKVLQKVRISGGRRCNVTHACFVPRELTKFYPRGEKELLGVFTRFCSGDTIGWYEERGVPLKIEADNRVFPVSDNSESIIRCLTSAAEKAGVKVSISTKVEDITILEDKRFEIQTPQQTFTCDQLLIASGSSEAMWKMIEKKLGHQIIQPVPSLFTFNIQDLRLEGLAGLSMPQAKVTVEGIKGLSASGAILVTHWGLSGPSVLRLSAWGARDLAAKEHQFRIKVNWLGWGNVEELKERINELKLTIAKKQVVQNTQFDIPNRLWKRMCETANISDTLRFADLTKQQTISLANELAAAVFEVKGKSTHKDEFVTAGGIKLSEINMKRMESRLHPNLFFVGEVLDIDAITGGFNFQAAWSGGYVAGLAMAED